MSDFIPIAELACDSRTVEIGRPERRPVWINCAGRPLRYPERNPFLSWKTMPAVEIRLWRLRDVVLHGNTMLITYNGRIVAESNYGRSAEEIAACTVDPERLVTLHASARVLAASDAWSANHYHWLNHTLPAIAASVETGGTGNLTIATPKLRTAHARTLDLLGWGAIRRIELDPDLHYAVPLLEFCSFTVGAADFADSAFIQSLHDRVAAAVPAKQSTARRIYISRLGDRYRRMASEKRLVDALRRRGIAIIDAARLGMDEQIQLFRGADLVIAPHGAGLANISFCRAGTRIYELLPAHYPATCNLTLSVRAGLSHWVDAFESPGEGPGFLRDWDLDVGQVLERIDEMEPHPLRRLFGSIRKQDKKEGRNVLF